jgi:hypothetical protein
MCHLNQELSTLGTHEYWSYEYNCISKGTNLESKKLESRHSTQHNKFALRFDSLTKLNSTQLKKRKISRLKNIIIISDVNHFHGQGLASLFSQGATQQIYESESLIQIAAIDIKARSFFRIHKVLLQLICIVDF